MYYSGFLILMKISDERFRWLPDLNSKLQIRQGGWKEEIYLKLKFCNVGLRKQLLKTDKMRGILFVYFGLYRGGCECAEVSDTTHNLQKK